MARRVVAAELDRHVIEARVPLPKPACATAINGGWASLAANGKPWYAAFGNGGQRLIVIPSLKMVVVIFAGNYNTADQWKMPVKLMSRIVLPAVLRSLDQQLPALSTM